jgi:hypothetical protein
MKMIKPRIAYDVDRVTKEPVVRLDGRFTIGDLVNVLNELEKRTGQMPSGIQAGTIDVIPIVSSQTGLPMVQLQSPAFDKPLQMDHAQAFEFGHTLIEVTAISIGDAVMFGFITGELGIAREEGAKMLFAFRGYRDRMLSAGDKGEAKT